MSSSREGKKWLTCWDVRNLSVTERARRLRAQYSLQAQGLRSRIEIRVNRIPISLRNMTMGDLLARYERKDDQRTAVPLPAPPTESRAPPRVPAKDPPSSSPQKLAFASPYKHHVYKTSRFVLFHSTSLQPTLHI